MSKQKVKNKALAKASSRYAWTVEAWEDYLYWQETDETVVRDINSLLDECARTPFKGSGKPEPLSGNLTGYWSRRINKKDRLVYLPEDGAVYVVQCRFHY